MAVETVWVKEDGGNARVLCGIQVDIPVAYHAALGFLQAVQAQQVVQRIRLWLVRKAILHGDPP